MKKILPVLLCGIIACASCAKVDISGIESRLDVLETVTVESLKTQINKINVSLGEYQGVQNQLSGLVTSLQGRVGALEGQDYEGLRNLVNSLSAKDKELQQSIDGLKTYIDNTSSDLKKWVADYYVTIERFTELQNTVSGINTSLATVISRLDAIDLRTQEIAAELESTVTEVTGKLSAIQNDITDIKTSLASLKGSMEELQADMEKLISAVQSVVVVPDNHDGSVCMTDSTKNEIRFEVYPVSAAEKLAEIGVGAFSLDYVETKATEQVNIPITDISFDGKFIVITADGSSFSDEIKTGAKKINARLRISDGTVTRSSEYFAIRYGNASPNPAPNPDPSKDIIAFTGEATHISCRNAEISGKANLPGTTSTDMSFGVLYSTSSGVLIGSATQIEAKSFDSDYNYTVNTEVLEPETTYYYRSYIIQDKEISYGELKSFSTLAVSSMIQTLDATDINPKDAVLNASLDLTDCKYDALEYGFEITPEGGSSHTIKSNNHSEKKFSAKDESLSRDTQYSVVAYVKLDGRTYKGEVKDFTTTSVQASVTAESSDVSYLDATISGKLTVDSEGTFTKSAVLYYSSTANTLDALKSSGTKKTLTLGSDGSYSIVLSSLVYNTQYNYLVIAKVDDADFNTGIKSFKTLEIPELVDLGLSVKWRSWNLGASNPEDYGGYYQWAGLGDVTSTSIYLDWWNCPYHTGSSASSSWTKYIPSDKSSYWSDTGSPDNKTVLDPEDDVAHVKLGGKWRMPTKEEWDELKNTSNCSWTWTTINGIKGYKVQSRKTGFTDNWIFLPAAGCRYGDRAFDIGSDGHFWSSSLGTDYPYSACDLSFYSGFVGTYDDVRYDGLSVRPVSE